MPANSATNVSETRAKARDKSVTRLSILEAARRLVAERGTDSLSLGAVAVEAGFARATVYGYFKSKNELLQALAAYDLAQLAGAMSGQGEWSNPGEEPATPAAGVQTVSGDDSDAELDTPHVVPDVGVTEHEEADDLPVMILDELAPGSEEAAIPHATTPAELSRTTSEDAGSIEAFAASLLESGAASDSSASAGESDTSHF